MFGQYPNFKLSHDYKDKDVLDWACGDGTSFDDICIGMQDEDYYGMHIQLWLVVMRKK